MSSTITDRLNGLTTSVAVKAPCRVATTANITLSGTQTIDGVSVVAGDRVLVKNQTSAVDNGIWVCGAGTWARSTDFDGTFDGVGGTRVSVTSGTVNENSEWRTDGEGAIVIGTDSIVWERATVSSTIYIDTENFTGSTIPDDSTAQEALQALETGLEFTLGGLNPHTEGATGDGTTDDSVDYAAFEADHELVYLPEGSVFNIEAELPTKPVTGPGALKLNGVTIDGLMPEAFPHRSSMIFNPADQEIEDWLYSEFPTGGGHAVTAFGASVLGGSLAADGSNADLSRITVFGATSMQAPVAANRVEAFGQGALRWTRYADRVTAVGTLAFQWGGADLTLDPAGHYYNHDIVYNLGTDVWNAAWDFEGMETANPGIRAAIATYIDTDPWAAATTDFARNVGVGRDAGVETIKGTNNSYFGYRAGAHFLDGDYNTAAGAQAGHGNVFGDGNTSVGYSAGYGNQTGDNNTAIGREALYDFITNIRNVGVGYRAGYGCSGGDNNVYIGPFSGNQDAGSGHASRFYLQPGATGYMVGDMANGTLAIGDAVTFAMLSDTKGLYLLNGTPVGGAAPNTSSRGLVIEDGAAATGITIKTLNTMGGQISFADPEDNNDGLIYYDHSTRQMEIRAANGARLYLTGAGMGFNGTAAITKPTGWGAPTGTATRTTFATSTVTTAQLAERVKALIDDLTSYGLIGA